MGYLRGLMESRPLLSRVPDQTLIAGDAGAGAEHTRAIRGDGYAMVYSPTGKPFRVNLEKLTGKEVKAAWFDPRSGKTTAVGQFAREGKCEFIPPGEPRVGNDWVLLLDDPQRGLELTARMGKTATLSAGGGPSLIAHPRAVLTLQP